MKSSLNLSRRLMQVLAVTLLACSQFFFFGCSSGEEDTTPCYTLTLESKYGCGTLSPDETSIQIKEGEVLTAYKPTVTPKPGTFFIEWQDADGNPFNFDQKITSDLTAYARYVSDIKRFIMLSPGKFRLDLANECVPFIKTDYSLYAVSGGVETPLTFTVTYDYFGDRTLTVPDFDSIIVDYSSYDFVLKNCCTQKTTSVPPAPANLSVTVEDRALTFSWELPSAYRWCYCELYDSSDTRIKYGDCYKSTTYTNLKNDEQYTFKIKTRSDWDYDFFSETVSISGTPAIVKKDVEYLMLMYLDGDNNLHDGIYLDLNEMEYGIYQSTSTSLEVIALWDGFVGDSETTPQIGSSGSKLYKVGKESSAVTTYVNSTGCVLGSNTKDISYTADWLSSGEVDMSSKQTLVNFLNWANAHYNAEKIVLQFSDHGGGPRAARPGYVTLKNGMQYKIPSGNERRSMCWDEGSGGKSFLKTSDVSAALNQAGFGTDNKLWLIIEDLCLGGSLEEAYQLKDYAQYYLGSPNNVPGLGLPYEKVIPHLTTTDNDNSKLSKIIDDYRAEYKRSASDWTSLLNDITTNYPSLGVTEDNLALFDWDACTLTAVDLSKMDALKTAVDAYAQEILDNDNQEIAGLYYDNSAREITETASATTVPLTYGRVIQDSALLRGGLLSYMGSYTWLFELGAVLDSSYNLASKLTVGETTYTWPNLAAKVLLFAARLDDCIIASWRDGNKGYGLYYNYSSQNTKTRSGILESGFYGLSISGGTVEMSVSGSNATLLPEKNPDWYKTELAFGKDSKWGDLLEYWFGDN